MLKHFCTLLINFIRTFFSISTIHGFNQLAERKRHPLEYVLWALLICSAIYGSAVLSSVTLTRYQDNPTVISMERDRFSWNTSFPAATICPHLKLNEILLDDYINNSTSPDKDALRNFIVALSKASYNNFDEIPKYDAIKSDDYMQLLVDLHFLFEPSVSNSGTNIYQRVLIENINENGICYSYNSHLATYNSPGYWKNEKWGLLPAEEVFNVNPLDGEVFANIVNISTGFDIYLHGPYEIADVASKVIGSPNGYFLQLYLSAITMYTSGRARTLKPAQRKCRFYHESNMKHSPVYSYVLCRMECRMTLANKLCNCIPHFYRKRNGEKVCDVDGLHCLAKYKDRLISLKRECNCLPNCDEVNYIIEHQDSRQWFLGSNLQWGLKEYPRMRLKRDVIFGFSDVLVYIGGMAGLFFGCSVLSLIEIIYFFTLRLFWFIVYSYKEKQKIKPLK